MNDDFAPARSKQELVLRVARGTGRPVRELGPGSKEKKALLSDIADALDFTVDPSLGKPEYAGAIARRLGTEWDPSCYSTGNTITLEGLNRLLRGAEAHPNWAASRSFLAEGDSEVERILDCLAHLLRGTWDGRDCVREMAAGGSTNWAQMEWPGFYFEYVGIQRTMARLGGQAAKIGNTTFDYADRGIWDFKAHAAGAGDIMLNDASSVEQAADTGRGIGFIVLTGDVVPDVSGSFKDWHQEFKRRHGKPEPTPSLSGRSRVRKAAFQPFRLDAYAFADRLALEYAIDFGVLRRRTQGRQQTGEARADKYELVLRAADGSPFHVAHRP